MDRALLTRLDYSNLLGEALPKLLVKARCVGSVLSRGYL